MDVDTIVLAFRCSRSRAEASHAGINSALLAAGCTTEPRCAMYAAQVGHETLSLYYDGEIWGPTAQQKKYDPASGSSLARQLGNTTPGDGYLYRGRGRIQLTGKSNYAAFGRWAFDRGLVPAADHFVRNPDLVAQAPWRDLAAAWYWTVARSGINALADKGDVTAVTNLINGGTNGLADRKDRYAGAIKLGARLLPTTTATPGGDWFDMASEADLRKIVREEAARAVWEWPIPDFYTSNPNDSMPAWASLGWATAHPAHARDRATEGRDAARAMQTEIVALRTALAKTTASSAAPLAADDIARLLREALAEVGPLYLTGRAPGTA